jgi:hypothetical protein
MQSGIQRKAECNAKRKATHTQDIRKKTSHSTHFHIAVLHVELVVYGRVWAQQLPQHRALVVREQGREREGLFRGGGLG